MQNDNFVEPPRNINYLNNLSNPKIRRHTHVNSLFDSSLETSSGYSYFRKDKDSPKNVENSLPSKIIIQKNQRSTDKLPIQRVKRDLSSSRSQALLNRVQNVKIQGHQRQKTTDNQDKYNKFMNEANRYMEKAKIKVNDFSRKLKQAKTQISKVKEACEQKDSIINEIQQTNKELVEYIEHLRKNRADRMYYQMFNTNRLK